MTSLASIAFDPEGNIYIAEPESLRMRLIGRSSLHGDDAAWELSFNENNGPSPTPWLPRAATYIDADTGVTKRFGAQVTIQRDANGNPSPTPPPTTRSPPSPSTRVHGLR